MKTSKQIIKETQQECIPMTNKAIIEAILDIEEQYKRLDPEYVDHLQQSSKDFLVNVLALLRMSKQNDLLLAKSKAMPSDKYTITDKFTTIDLNDDTSIKVYQIRALKHFELIDGSTVKEGDLGGYIESESNLSQSGNCWVKDRATVYGTSEIIDNALVTNDAKVSGCSKISGNAIISYSAKIIASEVFGDARIGGTTVIVKESKVSGEASIEGYVTVKNCTIKDRVKIKGSGNISHSSLTDEVEICGEPTIISSRISGKTFICGATSVVYSEVNGSEIFIEDNAEVRFCNLSGEHYLIRSIELNEVTATDGSQYIILPGTQYYKDKYQERIYKEFILDLNKKVLRRGSKVYKDVDEFKMVANNSVYKTYYLKNILPVFEMALKMK